MLMCSDLIIGNKAKNDKPWTKKVRGFLFLMGFLIIFVVFFDMWEIKNRVVGESGTPLALGARELVGSNPAYSTKMINFLR